jgi:hypothetical protein
MLTELDDYDWESAFSCASGTPQGGCSWSQTPDPAPGSTVSTAPFNREDVREIAGLDLGEHDDRDWIVCGWLNDGRLFFLSAGCDYTGWDCQSGGRAYVANTWEEIALVMTDEERKRMDDVDWSEIVPAKRCVVHEDCREHPALGRACASQSEGEGDSDGG